MSADSWPPKFTITRGGIAGLYVNSVGNMSEPEAVRKMELILGEVAVAAWDQGVQAGRHAEKNDLEDPEMKWEE